MYGLNCFHFVYLYWAQSPSGILSDTQGLLRKWSLTEESYRFLIGEGRDLKIHLVGSSSPIWMLDIEGSYVPTGIHRPYLSWARWGFPSSRLYLHPPDPGPWSGEFWNKAALLRGTTSLPALITALSLTAGGATTMRTPRSDCFLLFHFLKGYSEGD